MYILEFIFDELFLFHMFMISFDCICTDQYIIKLIYTKIVHIQHKIALIDSLFQDQARSTYSLIQL